MSARVYKIRKDENGEVQPCYSCLIEGEWLKTTVFKDDDGTEKFSCLFCYESILGFNDGGPATRMAVAQGLNLLLRELRK